MRSSKSSHPRAALRAGLRPALPLFGLEALVEPALEVHRVAPDRLQVIVGQEIDTREARTARLVWTRALPAEG